MANTERVSSSKQLFLSLALFCLSAAIAYFAYAVVQVVNQIPSILTQIESINKGIEGTEDTLKPLVNQIPDILKTVEHVNDSIPSVVKEVEAIRKTVPQLLNEVNATRESLPDVYLRVDRMQDQIDQLQNDVPKILQTSNDAVQVIHRTNDTVEKALPVVPKVLDQVVETRKVIPGYLDRVDVIVDNSKEISEQIGKGAITGVLKGVITSPFELFRGAERLVSSSFKSAEKMTEDDIQMIEDAAKHVLSSDEPKSKSWINVETGNEGRVTFDQAYQLEGKDCKKLEMSFKTKNDKPEIAHKDICMDEDGQWKLVEE